MPDVQNYQKQTVTVRESWLKDSKHESTFYEISGYTIFRRDRTKGGGGIMTYIKNGIGGYSAHKTKFQQS